MFLTQASFTHTTVHLLFIRRHIKADTSKFLLRFLYLNFENIKCRFVKYYKSKAGEIRTMAFVIYNQNNQSDEGDAGGICNATFGVRNVYEILVGKSEARRKLQEDLA